MVPPIPAAHTEGDSELALYTWAVKKHMQVQAEYQLLQAFFLSTKDKQFPDFLRVDSPELQKLKALFEQETASLSTKNIPMLRLATPGLLEP